MELAEVHERSIADGDRHLDHLVHRHVDVDALVGGALMLWRGEPLAELEGWVTAEAERVACRLCATAR